MIKESARPSFSSDEFLDVTNKIRTSDNINDLLVGTAEEVGVSLSAYMHIPAIGALDFGSNGLFHSYNMPESVSGFYSTLTDADLIIKTGLKTGQTVWLSDVINYSNNATTEDEVRIRATLEAVGDGLCCPLYGPENRKGFAFVGFGRDKSEFDTLMPYQVHSLTQLMHLRFCQLIKALQVQIKLTPREAEVLELICYGKTNTEIGVILGISPRTVDGHTSKVYLKLGTSDRVSTALRAQTINILI